MKNTQIAPQQALGILYQAARKAPLSGDDHDLVVQAANVLQEAVAPKGKEEQPKKK